MVDTITGAAPRYTRRRRAEMRAAWVAARTRNTLRHPVRLAAISGTVFTGALVLLVLAPRDARRASREIAPLSTRWRDTVPLLRAVDSTSRTLAVAESTVAVRRALATRPTFVPRPDTLSAGAVATRNAIAARSAELARLLERVENSPLPQSYRALGESPTMRDDPRVRVLLDSLADVEREREDFGAGGGVDPIFVALTARATAVGRSIQAVAESRQTALRDSLSRLRTAVVSAPVVVAVDTLGPLRRRDAEQARRDSALAVLAAARRANAMTDRQLREARAQANVVAPPIAILAASLVLGVTVGFAVALLIEIARPRVSDLQEAERVTGARVLAVIRPREIPPERTRRKADLRLPPLIDPTSDAYRLLASHASVAGSARAVVMITGDVPSVTATIAANIAAVSANEMRSTLLVDADLEHRPITSVLRLPAADGVAGILRNTATDLTGASVQSLVGRDRLLDVVPSGTDQRGPIATREAEVLREAIVRAARHYELTVIVSPFGPANDVRVGPTVLVCAHLAHSLVSTLRAAVASLRDSGAQITGIVLWAADAPSLEPPWIFESWFASDRTADAALAVPEAR
jgi:Mrp family chromosome partitioning ATPase